MVAFSFGPGDHSTVTVTVLKERHGKAKLSERLAPVMVHLCLKPKNKSYWGFAVNMYSEVSAQQK